MANRIRSHFIVIQCGIVYAILIWVLSVTIVGLFENQPIYWTIQARMKPLPDILLGKFFQINQFRNSSVLNNLDPPTVNIYTFKYICLIYQVGIINYAKTSFKNWSKKKITWQRIAYKSAVKTWVEDNRKKKVLISKKIWIKRFG